LWVLLWKKSAEEAESSTATGLAILPAISIIGNDSKVCNDDRAIDQHIARAGGAHSVTAMFWARNLTNPTRDARGS
jgi:hypothetical protein